LACLRWSATMLHTGGALGNVIAHLKSRLNRLESHVIPEHGQPQTMNIQFIELDKSVASNNDHHARADLAQQNQRIRPTAAEPK